MAGVKYTVGDTIGHGGTSDVVSASGAEGANAALKLYHVFPEAKAEEMSAKTSTESRMLAGWTCPWVVKGLGLADLEEG